MANVVPRNVVGCNSHAVAMLPSKTVFALNGESRVLIIITTRTVDSVIEFVIVVVVVVVIIIVIIVTDAVAVAFIVCVFRLQSRVS
jgi:hypothetical protein